MLVEEISANVETSAVVPSVGPGLTAEANADSVDGTEGEMDMFDAAGGRGDECTLDESSTSDEDGSHPSLAEEIEKEDDEEPWHLVQV